MAKRSSVNKNLNRRNLVKQYAKRRATLKAIMMDREAPPEDRFAATIKLSTLPRNSSATRIRNRCALSGRPRGYYRKFNMSRIALRDLAGRGLLPGVTKASW